MSKPTASASGGKVQNEVTIVSNLDFGFRAFELYFDIRIFISNLSIMGVIQNGSA